MTTILPDGVNKIIFEYCVFKPKYLKQLERKTEGIYKGLEHFNKKYPYYPKWKKYRNPPRNYKIHRCIMDDCGGHWFLERLLHKWRDNNYYTSEEWNYLFHKEVDKLKIDLKKHIEDVDECKEKLDNINSTLQ